MAVTDSHRRDIPIQDRTEAELRAENYALRSMLAARRVIDQAKGTIMLTHAVTAGAAVDLLHEFPSATTSASGNSPAG